MEISIKDSARTALSKLPSPINPNSMRVCAFFTATLIAFSVVAFPRRLSDAELDFVQCIIGWLLYSTSLHKARQQ